MGNDFRYSGNPVELLREFLAYLMDMFDESTPLADLFVTDESLAYIEEIQYILESIGCKDENKRFVALVRSVEIEVLVRIEHVEEEVCSICECLERLEHRRGYHVQEGIYSPSTEDLVVGVEWKSTGQSMVGNPSISVQQRPRRLSEELAQKNQDVPNKVSLVKNDKEKDKELCVETVQSNDVGDCEGSSMSVVSVHNIEIEVLPPIKSVYNGSETGFHIFVNIVNHTESPVLLRLTECCIYKNGRQHISDYNLTGYAFTEDYVFPSSAKTFAKIWITEKWEDIEFNNFDYLTVRLKNVVNGKLHYYKYSYDSCTAKWKFVDYYEID